MVEATITTTRIDAPVSRRSAPGFLLFLLLLVVAASLRVPGWVVPVFNSDESFLATQAEVLNHGGRLYEDAADRKPPIVPYLYAATFRAFHTTGLWSVRLVAAIAVALTGWLLALEAHRRWGTRAAWLAGLLFVLSTVAFAPQDGQAANFEIFMLLPMTAGVVLAARRRPASAGVAIAVATLCKQTGAAALLPVLYLALRGDRLRGLRRVAVGFAVPLIVVALLVGPGDLLFWAVLGNGSYVGFDTASLYVVGMFILMTAAFAACQAPMLWWTPSAWRDVERRRSERDLWLWLASSGVAVAFGFHFFGHYYLQLLPPLALIAAGSLAHASRVAVRRTVALAAVTAVGFSILGFWVQPFGGEPEYQSVSAYLEDRARPEDSILVWGQLPEVYWASGKRPATRFITTGFLTGNWGGREPSDDTAAAATPGAWDLFFADFAANPPRYVLDTTPAAIRGSQRYPMSRFPEFQRIIDRRYVFVEQIDGISVYRRVDPVVR
ncbi:MAG: ArnT family glycosyltransferase [Actinomycetes bacterium]